MSDTAEMQALRDFSTRGTMRDGSAWPGGSLAALQKALRIIDRQDAHIIELDASESALKRSLEISRTQTLDAFERVAHGHNKNVLLLAAIKEVLGVLEKIPCSCIFHNYEGTLALSVYCARCAALANSGGAA